MLAAAAFSTVWTLVDGRSLVVACLACYYTLLDLFSRHIVTDFGITPD